MLLFIYLYFFKFQMNPIFGNFGAFEVESYFGVVLVGFVVEIRELFNNINPSTT